MIKKLMSLNFLIGLFLLVTFSANPGMAGEPQPGDVIGPDNWQEYEKYIPYHVYVDNLKKGHKMKVLDAKIETSKKYAEETRKNAGNVKLLPDGNLSTYKFFGLPFAKEEIEGDLKKGDAFIAGEKIAWNMTFRWMGDDYAAHAKRTNRPWEESELNDGPIPDDVNGCRRYCINKYGQVIISDQDIYVSMPNNRMVVDPVPSIPGMDNLIRIRYYFILNPRDIAGQQILQYEYADAKKNDDLWIYMPSIRRIKRMPTSQRAATRTPADYNWDESFTWGGKVSAFEWKCVGKEKILLPMVVFPPGKIGEPLDNNTIAYDYNMIYDWVWVVEARSKDPNYANPLKVWYIDVQNYFPGYSKIYNKAGELWKYVGAPYVELVNKSDRTDKCTMTGTFLAWDLLADHKTFMYIKSAPDTPDLDPAKMYTIQHLYETSRGE